MPHAAVESSVHTFVPPGAGHADLTRHLPDIHRVVRGLARRHRLAESDEGDLLGELLVRLLDDDGAVLRRYRGASAISTYLHTVAYRLLLDARVKAWGKWRPSTQARRHGQAAVHFERLVGREGLTPYEARRVLDHHPRLRLEPAVAAVLAHKLARSGRRRVVSLSPAIDLAAPPVQDDAGTAEALRDRAALVRDALRHAVTALPPDDVQLLRQRFVDGRSVADIARACGVDQKPLYRRFDGLFRTLRRHLAKSAVGAADVRLLVGQALVDIGNVLA